MMQLVHRNIGSLCRGDAPNSCRLVDMVRQVSWNYSELQERIGYEPKFGIELRPHHHFTDHILLFAI